MKESFGTLSETIDGLIESGYTLDFNIRQESLVCNRTNIMFSPEEFQIDKVYRFEGATDPDDESIVYAISSLNSDVKGVLVNGYGISADPATSKLVEKLRTH
ncbi:MAG: phosphoribosylpyrophosphate synthetase [Sphingobacteriales bacterium]|nr:MAG: phosphoribosylpyrophosphate synthetase [Sphingobacteriales bacterium]